MTKRRTYGKTASGREITDEFVQELAAEAAAGYDVKRLLRRRVGRPQAPPPRRGSGSTRT